MIIHVLTEIALAIISFIVANYFWQLVKREVFLKTVLRQQSLLTEFIKQISIDKPSPALVHYSKRNPAGYFINLGSIVEADRRTIKRLQLIFIIVDAAIITVSNFISPTFFLINSVLIFLPLLFPLMQPARDSAFEHILEIATILVKWRSENRLECDEFINGAPSLQPLYYAISNVYGI